MSTAGILSNIHYFVGTVLVEARFSPHWNVKCLQHALHWASYCEQQCTRVRGKSYERQFGELITKLCTALSCKDVKVSSRLSGLALLENASQLLIQVRFYSLSKYFQHWRYTMGGTQGFPEFEFDMRT